MHTNTLLPRPRLVASGGPVTRAIATMRRDHADERQHLRDLRESIVERIVANAALIESLDRIAAGLRDGGRA